MRILTDLLKLPACLIVVFIGLMPGLGAAQTIIPAGAEVSGKWVRDSSPYLILGEITVPQGQKLSIEKGVELRFKVHDDSARYSESRAGILMVKGKLVAEGTERDKIIFTRYGHSGNWGVIFIDSTSRGTSLSHCIIRHAGTMNDVRDESINYSGLSFFAATAEVDHTILTSNRGYGITCHGDAAPVFRNCLIAGNYGAGVGVFSGAPVFEKCTIADNSSEGVYCYAAGSPDLKKTVIVGNEGSVRNGTAKLTDCIIDARPTGLEITLEETPLVNPAPPHIEWVMGNKPHDMLTQWVSKGIGSAFFKDSLSIARLVAFLKEE